MNSIRQALQKQAKKLEESKKTVISGIRAHDIEDKEEIVYETPFQSPVVGTRKSTVKSTKGRSAKAEMKQDDGIQNHHSVLLLHRDSSIVDHQHSVQVTPLRHEVSSDVAKQMEYAKQLDQEEEREREMEMRKRRVSSKRLEVNHDSVVSEYVTDHKSTHTTPNTKKVNENSIYDPTPTSVKSSRRVSIDSIIFFVLAVLLVLLFSVCLWSMWRNPNITVESCFSDLHSCFAVMSRDVRSMV